MYITVYSLALLQKVAFSSFLSILAFVAIVLLTNTAFQKSNQQDLNQRGQDHDRLTRSFLKEIQHSFKYQTKIRSIYFGGGTPSLAKPSFVESILNEISKYAQLSKETEVTLEANPNSIESMPLFKKAGINRVSLGIQSLQSRHLSFFKRDHTVAEGLKAIEQLVPLFDERVSVDLIWGIPGQTIDEWCQELKTVANLNIHHLSLYQLTQKKGTLLDKQVEQGLVLPNDELASQFFQSTRETLTDFTQYEVSSFVRTQKMDHQSVHNKAYWTGQDYIGIGPGAHGRYFDPIEKIRKNVYRILEPKAWMDQCESIGHGIRKTKTVSSQEHLEGMVILGLRMNQGIDSKLFLKESGGISLRQFLESETLQNYIDSGYLSWNGHLKVTAKGLELIDHISYRLLTDRNFE